MLLFSIAVSCRKLYLFSMLRIVWSAFLDPQIFRQEVKHPVSAFPTASCPRGRHHCGYLAFRVFGESAGSPCELLRAGNRWFFFVCFRWVCGFFTRTFSFISFEVHFRPVEWKYPIVNILCSKNAMRNSLRDCFFFFRKSCNKKSGLLGVIIDGFNYHKTNVSCFDILHPSNPHSTSC